MHEHRQPAQTQRRRGFERNPSKHKRMREEEGIAPTEICFAQDGVGLRNPGTSLSQQGVPLAHRGISEYHIVCLKVLSSETEVLQKRSVSPPSKVTDSSQASSHTPIQVLSPPLINKCKVQKPWPKPTEIIRLERTMWLGRQWFSDYFE